MELKTKVALEAIKGHKTANEIAVEYGVHPTQFAPWNRYEIQTPFIRQIIQTSLCILPR